jgi:crotonobetainyl-CoA:carnitine CoA-transferase CaiB-like acyl-CoA transferase
MVSGAHRVASGPLSGVRVLDCTRIVAGPMAAFYLASLGAEVIRVEMPGGDLSWKVAPFFGAAGEHAGPRGPHDVALGTIKRNRGKHSVVLSLREPAGRDVFLELVDHCDVLLENLRPGVLDRLGVGWSVAQARNARLVWCSLTGFGQFGPNRDRQAMDATMQALSGVQARTGFADGPPVRGALLAGDLAPAAFSVVGIVAALYARERTGHGQRIDVAMHDVLTSWLWDEPLDAYERRGAPPRNGNAEPRGVPSNTYATRDGWVALVTVDDNQWVRLATHIERHDLAAIATNADRIMVRERIDDALSSWCASRVAAEVEADLQVLEVPVAVVQPPWIGRTDPHVVARRSIVSMHDQHGRDTGYLGPRLPIHLSSGEVELAPVEALGQSTARVLRDLLGYTADQIAVLRDAGVLG